mmetsp:Transcript_116221/g.292196  ORF Transcript_116221/g.292196 Transcript_116221/m.292196 type:complete len:260 (-) Transcript_116221:175-954(-)
MAAETLATAVAPQPPATLPRPAGIQMELRKAPEPAGMRTAKYSSATTSFGTFALHSGLALGGRPAKAAPCAPPEKTTKSPGPAAAGTCTIRAGGMTSKVSPGARPCGTVTAKSVPSSRSNFSSAPARAPGGTSIWNSGCGDNLTFCLVPAPADAGGRTEMKLWGPFTRTRSPGTWLFGKETSSVHGGRAWVSNSRRPAASVRHSCTSPKPTPSSSSSSPRCLHLRGASSASTTPALPRCRMKDLRLRRGSSSSYWSESE